MSLLVTDIKSKNFQQIVFKKKILISKYAKLYGRQ